MQQKKICLVIPSLQAGGMERVMSELSHYFALKEEIELHLVLYGVSRQIFYKIPENIEVHKPSYVFNNKFRLVYTIRTLFFLRKEIKKIGPDSILSFGEYWNSYVLLALYGLKYPVYISDRCQPDKSLGKFHDKLRKLIYLKATGIIAQTEKARKIYMEELKHKNIRVIGNPIRHIANQRTIKKENIVLTVGRHIQTKHHDKLIELFISIANPDWKLVIIGYDHLKQNISKKLRNIIVEHQAENYVILEGKQSNVDAYYLKSKIFAFTSSSEGFPNVLGEAMSAGLPVIAFDCIAGPSDMIHDYENGFLIPVFDFKQFQTKLEMLMNNSELRHKFGMNASSSIKKYSISNIGEAVLNFICLKN